MSDRLRVKHPSKREKAETLLLDPPRIPSLVMKINKMSTKITCLIHHPPETLRISFLRYLLPMTLIKLEETEENKQQSVHKNM